MKGTRFFILIIAVISFFAALTYELKKVAPRDGVSSVEYAMKDTIAVSKYDTIAIPKSDSYEILIDTSWK